MRTLATLAALAALTVLADAGTAQCTAIPNSGCPGILPPQCSGEPKIGTTLTLTCLNNGRPAVNFTLIGNVAASITPLTGVTCASLTCGVAVDTVGVIALRTLYQPLVIQVPNDPSLIGKSVAAQCFDLYAPNLCIYASQALQMTFEQ